MKKVGLTPRLMLNPTYYEVRECWDSNWSLFVKKLGFLPIFLSVNFSKNDLEELGLDAVIFTGGNDLYEVDKNELSKKRDEFEKIVLEYCMEESLPVVGICRGMQFVLAYFGDIPVIVNNQVAVRHELVLSNKDSIFVEPLKKIHTVNSYHNYGSFKVGDCWNVLARSPDHVVKAVIHKKKKILAHMWHPEREAPFDQHQMDFIRNYIEENLK